MLMLMLTLIIVIILLLPWVVIIVVIIIIIIVISSAPPDGRHHLRKVIFIIITPFYGVSPTKDGDILLGAKGVTMLDTFGEAEAFGMPTMSWKLIVLCEKRLFIISKYSFIESGTPDPQGWSTRMNGSSSLGRCLHRLALRGN